MFGQISSAFSEFGQILVPRRFGHVRYPSEKKSRFGFLKLFSFNQRVFSKFKKIFIKFAHKKGNGYQRFQFNI